MTPIESAFLDAIRKNPEDDTPRLVYADWLTDQGDPVLAARAELIRLQCQLHRLPADDPRVQQLSEREAVLLRGHSRLWWRNRPGWAPGPYRRGFIDSVRVGAGRLGSFLSVAEQHPIAELHLQGRGSELGERTLARVACSPALADLRNLTLEESGPALADALLMSPHLSGLSCLAVHRATLPDLAGAAPLRHVAQLSIAGLDEASLQRLLRSPLLPAVAELGCPPEESSPHLFTCLAGANCLSSLRRLNLTGARLGADGLAALLAAPGFAVRHLQAAGVRTYWEMADVSGSDVLYEGHGGWTTYPNIGSAGVELLAASPAARQLRILDVRGNALSRNAVEALARSPFLVQLDELHADPGDNSPEEIGWPFLVERFGARLR